MCLCTSPIICTTPPPIFHTVCVCLNAMFLFSVTTSQPIPLSSSSTLFLFLKTLMNINGSVFYWAWIVSFCGVLLNAFPVHDRSESRYVFVCAWIVDVFHSVVPNQNVCVSHNVIRFGLWLFVTPTIREHQAFIIRANNTYMTTEPM